MQKEKLLISLGDSLGFTRDDKYSPKEWRQTWVGKVSNSDLFDSCWFMNMGGEMAKGVELKANQIVSYFTDSIEVTCIIQVGIVDASPRALPRSFLSLLSKILLLNKGSANNLQKNKFLLKVWGKPWTSPKKYRGLMEATVNILLRSISVKRVVLLGVFRPEGSLINKLGEFDVEPYNESLRELSRKYPNVEFLEPISSLHPDGYHMTKKAHEELATAILHILRE